MRTCFARIVEALNVVTRLDYTYRANVAEGLCSFGLGSLSLMPCRNVNTTLKMTPGASWTRRARSGAAEHDARVALTLAAACFAAGTCITRC